MHDSIYHMTLDLNLIWTFPSRHQNSTFGKLAMDVITEPHPTYPSNLHMSRNMTKPTK